MPGVIAMAGFRASALAPVAALVVLVALAVPVEPVSARDAAASSTWSGQELAVLESLSIERLPELPPSPGNPVADDPRAVELGHRLFFDTALSRTGAVSCASCHDPALNFRDARPRGRAIGVTERRTMSLVGAAWSPWLFWDGRTDSLWAQALEPLEDAREHGGTRLEYLHAIARDAPSRTAWEALFGPLPELADAARFPDSAGPRGDGAERARWEAMDAGDRRGVSASFANLGRALEAYQRRLVPDAAPFDAYVAALGDGDAGRAAGILDAEQVAGLALFVGEANCVHRHNGPLFTNDEFHNTGLFPEGTLPLDRGRIDGASRVQEDEFNCLGEHAGAASDDCGELAFVKAQGVELVAAFRTPSLRNIAGSGPYMHIGQFVTLDEVIEHYDRAAPTLISDELEPLGLTSAQKRSLVAFLRTLDGPLATEPALLRPPPRR